MDLVAATGAPGIVGAWALTSLLQRWVAPTRCDCHCSGSVADPILALLERQLERCGPAHLREPCPGIDKLLLSLLVAATFLLGVGLGLLLGRPPAEPPANAAASVADDAVLLDRPAGPTTPASRRALRLNGGGR